MQTQQPRSMPGRNKTKPHSIRMTESLWLSAKRRADEEQKSMNFVVGEFLDGYARGLVNLPRQAANHSTARRDPGHSIRATDELWLSAQRRARQEGLTMNEVVSAILDGYATGLMKQFIATKKAS